MDNKITENLSTPPVIFKRNEYGLLNNISYIFDENGFVNWRSMIPKEYLVPNKDRTSETDVSKLDDKDLLILLAGIKYLAYLRGITKVEYPNLVIGSDNCTTVCKITFLPNFETEGKEIVFSAIGDATPYNTKSFAKNYLGPIAENRSFVRCVRNFLRINIVGADEIGANGDHQISAVNEYVDLLTSLMSDRGITFDQIKNKNIKEGFQDAENWKTLQDIPKNKIFEFIERLKKINPPPKNKK